MGSPASVTLPRWHVAVPEGAPANENTSLVFRVGSVNLLAVGGAGDETTDHACTAVDPMPLVDGTCAMQPAMSSHVDQPHTPAPSAIMHGATPRSSLGTPGGSSMGMLAPSEVDRHDQARP